jgi:hypothetical protein
MIGFLRQFSIAIDYGFSSGCAHVFRWYPLGGVVFYARVVGGVWGKRFYEPRLQVHLRNPYGIKGVGKWLQLLKSK